MRRRYGLALRLLAPLELTALAVGAQALGLVHLTRLAATVAVALLAYALLPAPKALPKQPALAPPMVSGGLPVLG